MYSLSFVVKSCCLPSIESSNVLSGSYLVTIEVENNEECTLEGHSNIEDEEKRNDGREKGGEECPGVLRQPFVLPWPISVGCEYMNPTLTG